jgi:hypothetical protein
VDSEFKKLCDHVQSLPYGRNANRHDFSLVISEGRGSCSSKHAFLKQKAEELEIPNVELILAMYRMNDKNTPKIGQVLIQNDLSYLPEAHCYLKIGGQRKDLTSLNSDIKGIIEDVIEEVSISPEQVIDFKIQYHKEYLKNWIKDENIPFSFEEIWTFREQCISNLSLHL